MARYDLLGATITYRYKDGSEDRIEEVPFEVTATGQNITKAVHHYILSASPLPTDWTFEEANDLLVSEATDSNKDKYTMFIEVLVYRHADEAEMKKLGFN